MELQDIKDEMRSRYNWYKNNSIQSIRSLKGSLDELERDINKGKGTVMNSTQEREWKLYLSLTVMEEIKRDLDMLDKLDSE